MVLSEHMLIQLVLVTLVMLILALLSVQNVTTSVQNVHQLMSVLNVQKTDLESQIVNVMKDCLIMVPNQLKMDVPFVMSNV